MEAVNHLAVCNVTEVLSMLLKVALLLLARTPHFSAVKNDIKYSQAGYGEQI